MPLPKSASIGARATEVYTETCALVLKLISKPLLPISGVSDVPQSEISPTPDPESPAALLEEVLSYLPFLRQLLTCCACAGIAQDSMTSPACGHCYCYECQFRDPLLKIQCRQCRERKSLVVEEQLRVIVKLYEELVKLLSVYFKDVKNPREPLGELIEEVATRRKVSRTVLMIPPPPQYQMIPKHFTITPKKLTQSKTKDDRDLQQSLSSKRQISAKLKTKVKKKLMKKKKKKGSPTLDSSCKVIDEEDQAPSPRVVSVSTDLLKQSKYLNKGLKKKLSKNSASIKKASSSRQHSRHVLYPCRCGTNSGVTLGNRICARKKCNCFVNKVPCKNCKCRGCCNPFNETSGSSSNIIES